MRSSWLASATNCRTRISLRCRALRASLTFSSIRLSATPTWPTSVCGFGLGDPFGKGDLALVQLHLGDPGGGGCNPSQRSQRQPDDRRADERQR